MPQILAFSSFANPLPAAYFHPPFINFSNFMSDYKDVHRYIRRLIFGYCKQLRNILEIPMLSEVNSV